MFFPKPDFCFKASSNRINKRDLPCLAIEDDNQANDKQIDQEKETMCQSAARKPKDRIRRKSCSAFDSYSQWNGISPLCFHLNGIWKHSCRGPCTPGMEPRGEPSQPSAADLKGAACPEFTAPRAQVKSFPQTFPNLHRHLIPAPWDAPSIDQQRAASAPGWRRRLPQTKQHSWHGNHPLPAVDHPLGLELRARQDLALQGKVVACLEGTASLCSHVLSSRIWKIS